VNLRIVANVAFRLEVIGSNTDCFGVKLA
jgi:hypothetical protein